MNLSAVQRNGSLDDNEDHDDERDVVHLTVTPPPGRGGPVRGRYAKFTTNMDVALLEALRLHNPFTARHGTRLQMWHRIAQTVGEELIQNPDAFSWHTCRDRVTSLMKLYADGKHDKLFKHGTAEEKDRKESILREMDVIMQHKGAKRTTVGVRSPLALLESQTGVVVAEQPHATSTSAGAGSTSGHGGGGYSHGNGSSAAKESNRLVVPVVGRPTQTTAPLKRRRTEAPAAAAAPRTVAHQQPQAAAVDGDTFRARVLSLMEAKVQFDMEQRIKENELRDQEFELQKRFLEYLQSK